MLKKTITYTNYNDEQVTEDFYFNLSKSEVAELEMSRKGGLTEHLQSIIKNEDPKEIISTFREIIRKSVGRRSPDGRKFEKSPEILSDFMDTGAYDEIFMELVTNGEAGAAFISGVIPKGLGELGSNDIPKPSINLPTPPEDNRPAWIREDRDPTPHEVAGMTKEQLVEAMRRKSAALGSTSDGSAL